jgi:glycosyltransferase involved in cell wall biosynthesis
MSVLSLAATGNQLTSATMSTICILEPTHWGKFQGGAEIQSHFLANHIADETKHTVVYLARWIPDDVSAYRYNIVQYQGPRPLRHLRWGQTGDSKSIYDQLRRISPDVILQMQAGAYLGAGAFYAKRQNIPLVWYIASDRDLEANPPVGTESPFKLLDQTLFKYGIRNADYIIAQTKFQERTLLTNLKRRAVAVVHNFHPVPDKIEKLEAPLIVSWIANLKPLKRPLLFAKLAEAFKHRTDLSFVMAGRSDNSDESRQAIDNLERLPNGRYLGELQLDEVNKLLESSHLLINTSEYEGFPNIFIQAWLRGVPTLSINVDPDDLMLTHSIGKMSGCFDGLIDDVKEFSTNSELRISSGKRARDFSSKNFSMRNAARVVEIMEAAIRQGKIREPT